MRVTIIAGAIPPTDAPEGVTAIMIAGHLARLGCEVTLLTKRAYAGPGLPEAWRDRRVDFQATVRDWSWRGWWSLRRALKRSRPDAVLLIYVGYLFDEHPMITYLPTLCRGLRPRPRVLTEFSHLQGAEPRTLGARLGRRVALLAASTASARFRTDETTFARSTVSEVRTPAEPAAPDTLTSFIPFAPPSRSG